MRQFEYLEVELGHMDTVDYLNEAGEEGWELVQIIGNIAIMKRGVNQNANEVTIDEVLHDIETKKIRVSSRVRYILNDAKRWEDKTYLREVVLPSRNFGEKSKKEWIKLNKQYGNFDY